jgi:hypothetical protein
MVMALIRWPTLRLMVSQVWVVQEHTARIEALQGHEVRLMVSSLGPLAVLQGLTACAAKEPTIR